MNFFLLFVLITKCFFFQIPAHSSTQTRTIEQKKKKKDSLPSKSCNSFQEMKMDYAKVRWILFGQNALRDRIAYTQNVSNMVKLAWDEQLELMAMQWIKQCARYDKDECTRLKRRGK